MNHQAMPNQELAFDRGAEQIAVELKNVWKVFGNREAEAMSAIRAQNLSKTQVLEDYNCVIGVAGVDLAVKEGETFCVMGLSGSGKSTLIRHITRLIEPTSGEISIFGENIGALSPAALRRLRSDRIGMVFQNFALLPQRTVRENVALPLELRGATKLEQWRVARDALKKVELEGWEESYPHQLSGGMRQRVGLARALAADPDILLMDEPFSALDPLIRNQLQDEFVTLAREMKKTTLFITHDLDEAIKVGDRIAIMRDGKIVQMGTPADIIERPADDYVARFVGGDLRVDVLSAKSICEPLEGDVPEKEVLRRISGNAQIPVLIEKFTERNEPLLVTDDSQEPIGLVTEKALFKALHHSFGSVEGRSHSKNDSEQPAPEMVSAEKAIEAFSDRNSGYYFEVFQKIATSRFPFSQFNWAAALLGPVWAAARGLWLLFAIGLFAEIAALTYTGQGLWGDYGTEYLDRAEMLQTRAVQLAERAKDAEAKEPDKAEKLRQMSANLDAGVKEAMAQYQAASKQRSVNLAIGLSLFLLVKLLEGAVANFFLEKQFHRWRTDDQTPSGFSSTRLLSGAVIAVSGLLACLFAFTFPQAKEAVPWMFEFPANTALLSTTGQSIDDAIYWISINGAWFFSGISYAIRLLLDAMEWIFVSTPWPIIAVVVVAFAWRRAGFVFAAFVAVCVFYLGYFDFWKTSMETVALLGTASILATILGIPLGIWFGKSQRAYIAAQPILDFAQTMPAFVYLIPVIAFFGIGKPPAIIATLIFGMPPVIRLTALGIQQVPHDLKEAAIAFGANRRQLLTKVELPLSKPSIMAGINQTTLMCLAMVVIASLIGAKGLGQQVLEALQYANKGAGLLAGLAILICAIVIDRMVQSRRTTEK